MNRSIFIRRLTGPAILLLLGFVALLSEAHVVHLRIFIPLLLILLGVLKLAEHTALAGEKDMIANPYAPGAPYAGSTSASIVPPHQNGSDADEGKL